MEKVHSAEPVRAALETPSPERVKAEERSWSAAFSASERTAPLLGVVLMKEVERLPVLARSTSIKEMVPVSWRNAAASMETGLRSSVVEPTSLPASMVISGVSLVPVTVTTMVVSASLLGPFELSESRTL